MEKLTIQDAQYTDFEIPLPKLAEAARKTSAQNLEIAIQNSELIYFGQRPKHTGEIFLPGETQFLPLTSIPEKFSEYREELAKKLERSEEVGFKVDFGILALIMNNSDAIESLKTHDFKWFENKVYELGIQTLPMVFSTQEDFNQERYGKYLREYGEALKERSKEQRKMLSNAIQVFRETWRGILGNYETDHPKTIIPDEPDDVAGYLPDISTIIKPVTADASGSAPVAGTDCDEGYVAQAQPVNGGKAAPATGNNNFLKALGIDTRNLEDEILAEDVPDKEKENVLDARTKLLGMLKLLYTIKEVEGLKKGCKRDQPYGTDIFLCMEPTDKYNGCQYKGDRFQNPGWSPRCNLETRYKQLTAAKR